MSAEENKAKVRRIVEEVYNKGNLDVVDEILASDYIYHGPGGQEVRGPEGMKQMMGMFRSAFPDLYIITEDLVAEGDKVVQRYTVRGTHKGDLMGIAPTGKQVTITGMIMLRFAGGRIAEGWENYDELGMMQQLGVVAPPGEGGE